MSKKKYSVGDVLDFTFEIDGRKAETKVIVTESYSDTKFKFAFIESNYQNIVEICEKEGSDVY